MSKRLFKYYATENMEETSSIHETQGLTSTPADQLRHKAQTNILLSPIPMEPMENQNYEDLSKQVNVLS